MPELWQIHDISAERNMLYQREFEVGDHEAFRQWVRTASEKYPNSQLELVNDKSPHFFVTGGK